MKVEVISPNGTLYLGEALSVTVPSTMGPFTLLEHHAAIVSVLEAGMVSLNDDNGESQNFAINGGFVENHNNQLTICVEL